MAQEFEIDFYGGRRVSPEDLGGIPVNRISEPRIKREGRNIILVHRKEDLEMDEVTGWAIKGLGSLLSVKRVVAVVTNLAKPKSSIIFCIREFDGAIKFKAVLPELVTPIRK